MASIPSTAPLLPEGTDNGATAPPRVAPVDSGSFEIGERSPQLRGKGPLQAPAPVNAVRNFRTLVGKNAIIKKRDWSSVACCSWCPLAACCELVLPLAVVGLLWWAKTQCDITGQCQKPVLAGWGGSMPDGDISTTCVQGLQLEQGGFGLSQCDSWTDHYDRPIPMVNVLSFLHWSNKTIALVVDDESDRAKIETMRDVIAREWHPDMLLTDIPCVDLERSSSRASRQINKKLNVSTGLPCETRHSFGKPSPGTLPSFRTLTHPNVLTSDELDTYLDSADYGNKGQFYAALVFHSVGGQGEKGAPGHWDYTIRLNQSIMRFTTSAPKTRTLTLGLRMREAQIYVDKGFSTLQLLLDRYIIGHRGVNNASNISLLWANAFTEQLVNNSKEVVGQLSESLHYAPQSLETVPFPVAGVVVEGFYELLSVAFPLLLIVAFLYTQKKVINELITEKETKVRESLRMIGVSNGAIIASWYVTYGIIFAVICGIFTIGMKIRVFPHSNVVIVFLFFWLWSMAFLAFAFFIHCFFHNARTGGIVGMIVLFGQWILYSSQSKNGTPAPPNVIYALLLLPNAGFAQGLTMLSKYEGAGVGANFDNLFMEVDNASFIEVLTMFLVDFVFWTAIGWYLDQILPKEFGVRLPPHFCCQASYWSSQTDSSSSSIVGAPVGLEGVVDAECSGEGTVEDVPEGIRKRSVASGLLVRTVNLRREFSTPGGTKVAVEGLNLCMYEGQIMALLGHNGAGKSTTINMLTGMLEPSSGDATVAGLSLRGDMAAIRRVIGVCPQHDVLWLELTVLEHLRIYGRLCGVAPSEVAARAEEMMKQVGLTEKVNTRAGSLSGGQKRKLSLCLALIGNPRVAFLDEPTSGMDPYSRRSTWNILRSARDGRVTVLTTHFMDEADILGDRVAIMANGILQCCGSSLFLKNRFGAGYRITCARTKKAAEEVSNGTGASQKEKETVTEVIQRHVPESELLTDMGAELSLRLPTSAVKSFPDLFEELDARLDELGLEHYGLSMVTLEEVFLRVASGDMTKLEVNPDAGLTSSQIEAAAANAPEAPALTSLGSPPPAAPTKEFDAGVFTAAAAGGGARRELGFAARSVRHLGALFLKRARYGRRDYKSLMCTTLIPVVMLVGGLFLLERASDSHFPSMEMSLGVQYPKSSGEVPYNVSGIIPWLSVPGSSLQNGIKDGGGKPIDESGVHGPVDGLLFGREYEQGIPKVRLCQQTPLNTTDSKCFREKTYCNNKKLPIQPLLKSLNSLGLNFGCTTTQKQCNDQIDEVCKVPAKGCEKTCKKVCAKADDSTKASCENTCKPECITFCDKQSAQMKLFFCGVVLAQHSVAWACPVECANYKNPDTCEPGTSCHAPKYNMPNPAGILSLDTVTFEAGQGRLVDSVRYGGLLLSQNEKVGLTATVLFNTSSLNAVPTYANLMSNAFKQAKSGPGSSIKVSNHPFPLAKTETIEKVVSAAVNLLATFVIIIAYSFIPAAIVAYVVREREDHHNSKHQQLISGVSLIAYWTANLLWDTCVYCVPLLLSIFCLWAFDIEVFVKNGALFASFVVFLGYGLAIAPFTYLISFMFQHHTSAQVLCLVINFVTGLILMITSFILSAVENTKDVNASLMWVYRLFPGFCLGHGLLQICTRSLINTFVGDQAPQVSLLSMDVAGKDVLYLYISAPVYFLLTLLIDYLLHSPLASYSRHLDVRVDEDADEVNDPDVEEEAQRVASGATDGDVVRLMNLRKIYRTPEGLPKVAVKGLSFGLKQGECFGFLGVNGAGKTSTLNMLTGAILPSGGAAFLHGHDVVLEQWEVRRYIGYCPQHDALLDKLTVREHLELFARIKGVPLAVMKNYCHGMMKELDLLEHVDKTSMTLSGGNKRKLSMAIAFMGAPPLIFLDEPSTGVDPAARRLMWNVISAVSTTRRECSVILTTHNMEEAEALCSSIGIMVGGRLRCIGSNQHLKARFGGGYQLETRLRRADSTWLTGFCADRGIPEIIPVSAVVDLCQRLGAPGRANLVRPDCEAGHAIYEMVAREGQVDSLLFADWWLLEDRVDNLTVFLQQNFPGTTSIERHDRTLRFSLPRDLKLADVFRKLEDARVQLHLEEYGISQMSLEQIFNQLAAQQTEETGAVRGFTTAADVLPTEVSVTSHAISLQVRPEEPDSELAPEISIKVAPELPLLQPSGSLTAPSDVSFKTAASGSASMTAAGANAAGSFGVSPPAASA